MKLVWRKRAETAFLDQIAYVKAANPGAAVKLAGIVDRRIALLQRHPEMGRPSRRVGVRELVIADTPYIAVYTVQSDTITILQFFHARQNR